VPLAAGSFGLDGFVQHLIDFLRAIGPGAHLMAICQPSVPALAAAALMAEDDDPAQPRSLILMAGPIDTRVNPTAVNELAMSKPIGWFERNVIGTVPLRYKGGFRRVYPGFVQLASFMSMNLDRHVKAFNEMWSLRLGGDPARLAVVESFYDEYLAVMDLDADFFLETVRSVFQTHDLPLGRMRVGGRLVDPLAIRRAALLTVEGEKDDICAIGQTLAAQEMCGSIRPYLRRHHVQTGVGHYGVFSGRRWTGEIYPIVRDIIHMAD
jgi:polyhydroxyalkanoate depolymerase